MEKLQKVMWVFVAFYGLGFMVDTYESKLVKDLKKTWKKPAPVYRSLNTDLSDIDWSGLDLPKTEPTSPYNKCVNDLLEKVKNEPGADNIDIGRIKEFCRTKH